MKEKDRVNKLKLRHLNPLTQFRNVFTSFTLRILFVASLAFFLGLVMQQSNFSVFLKEVMHWQPVQIGIMLTVVGLVDFFAEGYLTGKLLPIFGDMRVVRIGVLLTGIGMLLVGMVAFTYSSVILYVALSSTRSATDFSSLR